MAASVRLCDICETREITIFATDWCPECEQGLCKSCKSYHSASKLSKTHETIPFESFDKLPAAVKEIKNDCPDHEERFEYYCSQHELPCCVECMKTTHAECRHLTSMQKVVQHFKTSHALPDFEQTLSDLLHNLNSLIQDRFDNVSLLAKEKETCLKEIAETKRKVNAHLDKLEIILKNELEILHKEHLQAIEKTTKDFEQLKTNVAKMQEEAYIIKQYASDFQLFMAFRELENTVKNMEADTQLLIKKDSAKQILILFSTTVMESIEKLLPTLGTISMIAKSSDIKLINHRQKQAQLLSIETPCIDKIQIKCVFEKTQIHVTSKKENQRNTCIYDNGFLLNGRFVFSDKLNKRLIFFKDNGQYDADIHISFLPSAVAFVTDNKIAVGVYNSSKINMVNMTTSSVDNSFEVKGHYIESFSFRKEQFLVLLIRFGFCITDKEGNVLNKIRHSASNILFSVLLNDKIYFSQWKEDQIVCCDLKGNNIFEFKDKKLISPVGVACNDEDILFITGFKSRNIYALSSTGNECKELYCNSNLSGVRAISYNSIRKQLLVSTEDGKVSLFDISY